MLFSAALLLVCAVLIYAACGYFVNGVEWLGARMNLDQTATGTVLAALGTALPESAVTLVAVVFGATEAQKEIGIGAALGGPLVLATVSYAMVGFMLLWRARRASPKRAASSPLPAATAAVVQADTKRLRRDQGWFAGIFVVKIALGLLWFSGKPWFALFFIAAYLLYAAKELRQGPRAYEGLLEPLRFCPKRAVPPMWLICAQTLGAVAVIGLAAHSFVGALEAFSAGLGMPPQLAALLLSPIATELPETMNALIWVRQGKERLALANISGAMMIQATVPSALGLVFTPWVFSRAGMAAGGVTLLAIALLWMIFRAPQVHGRRLLPIGLLYGLFVVLVVALA